MIESLHLMQTPTQTIARPIIHLPRHRVEAPAARPAQAMAGPDVPPMRSLDSGSLLAGSNVVEIRHHDAVYRLSATRQGKLILTK